LRIRGQRGRFFHITHAFGQRCNQAFTTERISKVNELIVLIVQTYRTVLLDYRCLFETLLWRTIRLILGQVASAQALIMQVPLAGHPQFLRSRPAGTYPMRLYQPAVALAKGEKRPLVLYFHGGGFTSGSLDDDTPASFLAEHNQAVVLSVAYALAPAKPFPAAPKTPSRPPPGPARTSQN
jgi:acetyl esterase/lipase